MNYEACIFIQHFFFDKFILMQGFVKTVHSQREALSQGKRKEVDEDQVTRVMEVWVHQFPDLDINQITMVLLFLLFL